MTFRAAIFSLLLLGVAGSGVFLSTHAIAPVRHSVDRVVRLSPKAG